MNGSAAGPEQPGKPCACKKTLLGKYSRVFYMCPFPCAMHSGQVPYTSNLWPEMAQPSSPLWIVSIGQSGISFVFPHAKQMKWW